MTDFDSLREDMANGPLAPIMGLIAAIEVGQQTDKTLGAWLKEASAEIVKLWENNAALRDELHALANRVESLTRARLTEPAEVAEAIQRGNLIPEGRCGDPHAHTGHVWRSRPENGSIQYRCPGNMGRVNP